MTDIPVLTKQSLYEILSQRFDTDEKKLADIPDPSLLHDASKAAARIAKAIKEKQKITLVGDYDVDGISATAIMIDFFSQIPYPLEAVIPNRFNDGYGVSPSVLQRIEADLVITVDNGITALEAAAICKQRGIDLIITDHHTPLDTLPDAYAIVDPKISTCRYPFKEICGAQVAWLLLGLLKKELSLDIDMKQFLDILCIAIIADVMPLIDINRTLVKEGLKMMMRSKRASSIVIRDFINKSSISSEDIGFQIAPRINSAGRLEDASIALKFYTAKNTNEAYKQFELLGQLNDLRKATEAECTKKAMQHVDPHADVIVVAGQQWHEGVVGIVASRLVDAFEKPVIVLSLEGENAKGSARSIGDVNIHELIKENEHLLINFGGHKMAAGLSLSSKNIDSFREAINKSAAKLHPDDFIPKEQITGILPIKEIDHELLELIEKFEPYGEANARPTFLMKDADILDIKLIGADKSHSKIQISQFPHAAITKELIAFKTVLQMPKDRKLTCSFSVSKNEFNKKVSAQLLVNKIYNNV